MQLGLLPRLPVSRVRSLSGRLANQRKLGVLEQSSIQWQPRGWCAVHRMSSACKVMADANASNSKETQQLSSDGTAAPPQDVIIQYIVLRKDLWAEKKWPLGSVVAQACHASTAAMHMFRDDADTVSYLQVRIAAHMFYCQVIGLSTLRCKPDPDGWCLLAGSG